MAKLVDLNQVRRAWDKKYGPAWTRGAMGTAWPGSGMAHDAMPPRRARDQDPPDDSSGGIEQVKTFLQNRLSPEDYQRLCQMMKALNGGGEPEAYEPDDESEFASVEGTGGGEKIPEHAQDSARYGGGYFSQFPGNRRVGFGYGD